MFALLIPYTYAIPEIDRGTADLVPSVGGHPALPNANNAAPSLDTQAVIYAANHTTSSSWDLDEYMAVFPVAGVGAPLLAADQRHPPEFELFMRPQSEEFANLSDFKAAVETFAQTLGQPVAWVEARGRRLSDLQATGFPNAVNGPETRDLFDIHAPVGTPPIGAAYLARTSATTTSQHWVLFDASVAFDEVRAIQRPQSHTSTQAFLAEMQQRRNNSLTAFRHAYEEATHFPDVLAL
ncbi:MAG: hypothetical protein H6741_30495 [Alphaproteobacteria bacterium]|nr:hypothetical protein [Alphaproteobacteria bacterium]